MRIVAAGLFFALLSGAAGPGALAQPSGRALLVAYSPSGQLDALLEVTGPDGTTGERNLSFQAQGTSGLALEFAQRFGRWFGYTAHLSYVTEEFTWHEHSLVLDAATNTAVSDTVSVRSDETMFVPLLGSFDLHLLPSGRWDLYAGPLLGYIWYDNLFGTLVDDHFVYGLGAGLDVGLGGRWAMSGAVRFIQAEAEFRQAKEPLRGLGEINVDPWQVEFGVAYRFGKAGP
jgi:hypothetical protein